MDIAEPLDLETELQQLIIVLVLNPCHVTEDTQGQVSIQHFLRNTTIPLIALKMTHMVHSILLMVLPTIIIAAETLSEEGVSVLLETCQSQEAPSLPHHHHVTTTTAPLPMSPRKATRCLKLSATGTNSSIAATLGCGEQRGGVSLSD